MPPVFRPDIGETVDRETQLAPFAGPQMDFLRSSAKVVITGGSVGGGKTGSLLLDVLKYHHLPSWRGIIFRRQSVDLMAGGGVFDTARDMYGKVFGSSLGIVRGNMPLIRFPSGAELSFRHLQSDGVCENYRSAQLPWIGFEEFTEFTEYQFTYMTTRNRSPHGYPERIRATTNPDSESWLAKFLAWWINPKTGYAIPSRSGKWRYYLRDRATDALKWYGSTAEAVKANPDNPDFPGLEVSPTSVSFIPSNIRDNPILYQAGSSYVSGLSNLTEVERERLLKGNWLIVAEKGEFRRDWFAGKGIDSRTLDRSKLKKLVRAWDLASTPKEPTNNPDWTVGALDAIDDQDRTIISNIIRGRWDSGDVEGQIAAAAKMDRQMYGDRVETIIEQEPGSSGKGWVEAIIRKLNGFAVSAVPCRENKVARSKPLATQAKAGNVYFEIAGWNDDFFGELYRYPFGSHDDQVDAVSHGHQWLTDNSQAGFSADDYKRLYGV